LLQLTYLFCFGKGIVQSSNVLRCQRCWWLSMLKCTWEKKWWSRATKTKRHNSLT